MAVYLPIRALNRSQNVRIGKGATAVKLSSTATSYVDITDGNVKRDLQRHSAIGSYIVVGALTISNLDEIVQSGVTTSPTNLVITVAAGELKVRSTGAFITVAGGTTTLSTADATKDRTDLITVDAVTGAQNHTNGALANPGLSVAPATPAGKIPVATYLVAATATVAVLVADVRPRP